MLPVFIAAGSALLSFAIMQARMEVAIAREREVLAEARASINTYKITVDDRIRAAEEETRRKALNEFMQEFRVEERSYVRENKSATSRRKTMVMQERLYFRNIPLSNWVDHEVTMEETTDMGNVPQAFSVFTAKAIPEVETDTAALARLLT